MCNATCARVDMLYMYLILICLKPFKTIPICSFKRVLYGINYMFAPVLQVLCRNGAGRILQIWDLPDLRLDIQVHIIQQMHPKKKYYSHICIKCIQVLFIYFYMYASTRKSRKANPKHVRTQPRWRPRDGTHLPRDRTEPRRIGG